MSPPFSHTRFYQVLPVEFSQPYLACFHCPPQTDPVPSLYETVIPCPSFIHHPLPFREHRTESNVAVEDLCDREGVGATTGGWLIPECASARMGEWSSVNRSCHLELHDVQGRFLGGRKD